jgi:3-hydroxyacyl-CoA dehydrogenase, NAD binding domain
LRSFVKAAWPALDRLGLAPGASQSHLTFTSDLPTAVRTADFVQENDPERIDFKQNLYRQLDELLPAEFFLDLGAGRILSVNPDGSDLKTVLTEGPGPHPDGVVVDPGPGHIYWTNMGNFKANDGSIERCDLDGKNRRFVVPPGGTHTPKQLQIEKETRKLYWCDREGMRVMRANLDGSNIETLVDTSLGDPRPGPDARKWCVGIAVAAVGGKLYWTQKGSDDAGEGCIFRSNIELPKGQTPAKSPRHRITLRPPTGADRSGGAPWQTQPLQRRKRPGMSSTHGPPKCSCARRPRASSVSSFPRSARPWCQVDPSWTLIPDHVLWFSFNLREDAWGDLSVGSE